MKWDVEQIKAAAAPRPRADREPGVLVANEVLDLCGESYQAADEKRSKSSKKLFDDTGIMALVCRHDRVLFWVNMTEAGEKQYYMLALLDKLFMELPSNLTVGFLYDIACQLHRSISKVCFQHFYSSYADGHELPEVEPSSMVVSSHYMGDSCTACVRPSVHVPNYLSSA